MSRTSRHLTPLLAAVSLACSGARVAPPPAWVDAATRGAVQLGPERPIRSREDLPLVEPCVAGHPRDDAHLLVGAMVVTDVSRPYESARLASFLSDDGGATWSETTHDAWDYDPWAAIGDDGEAVLAWIGTPGGFQDRYPVQLFRSSDGGRTWRAPETLAGAYDGTKVVAWRDRFWFTTVRFDEAMGTDVVLLTARGSGPFEEVARIPGRGARLRFAEPAVLPDGRVVLPAQRGDRTFVQVFDPATGTLGPERHVHASSAASHGYVRLAADTAAASPYRGRLYLVRAAARGDEHLGVVLNVSADGGRTWREDRRVDRFAPPGPSRAQLATVAVNAEGVVAVTWIDAEEDPARHAYDTYLAVSFDGGESFLPPVRLSTASADPRTPRNADVANKFPAGGHYMGLAARAGGSFQAVWSDSREGVFVLRTREARALP